METRGSDRSPSDRKPTSWTARILAPLVLVIVAAALFLVVSGSLNATDDPENEEKGSQRATSVTCAEPEAPDAVEAGYYVVEPEEDLTTVSNRTCISLDRLIKLNENLDPQAIPVGGCISLRRDACKELSEG